MSRDKTPFNAEEKKIISDIGSRNRTYLKYKGFSYQSEQSYTYTFCSAASVYKKV